MNKKPQILILGGGFAGLGAAQKLAKSEVEITMVDKHNYHTFQPMLYGAGLPLPANASSG